MPIRLLEPRTIAGYRYGEGTILDLQDDKEEEYLVDRAVAEWYSVEGDDALAKANNLADVPDKAAARSNLQLGALATQDEAPYEPQWATAIIRGVGDKLDERVSIEDFGATGGDATRDTDGFQKALLETGIQKINLLGKSYVIADTLTHSGKPISICGSGINNTRLIWNSDATNTGLSFAQADDDYHINISGLSFITGKAGTGTAIAVDGSGQITGGNIQNRSKPRLRVSDVEFRGLTGVNTDGWNYGLDAVSVMAAQMQHCYFAGKYTTDNVNIISSSMCRFSGSGNPVHINVSKCDAYYAQECVKFEGVEGGYVNNNNFVNVGKGVVFNGSVSAKPMLQCVNNHVNAYVTGVELENCSQANVSQNLIYSRSGALDIVKGIHLKSGTLYSIIAGNILVSAAAPNSIDGIILEIGAEGNFIGGNLFQGGNIGISSLGSSITNNIGLNYFQNTTTNFFGGATLRHMAGSAGSHTFDAVVRPTTSGAIDLGGSSNEWRALYLSNEVRVGNVKILGGRDTGWGATMTGSADKATERDVATVTTAQLAARFKALEDALRTHGLIGS
jgi:hypothetical protein